VNTGGSGAQGSGGVGQCPCLAHARREYRPALRSLKEIEGFHRSQGTDSMLLQVLAMKKHGQVKESGHVTSGQRLLQHDISPGSKPVHVTNPAMVLVECVPVPSTH